MALETPNEGYTVSKDETLSSISKKLGFKNWQELAALQGAGFNPNKIRPGQVLVLKKAPLPREDGAEEVAGSMRRAASLRAIEPITMNPDELLKGLDAIMPATLPLPDANELTAKSEKPGDLSESESLIWDTIRALGLDPQSFENQSIKRTSDGMVRITAPGTRFEKMRSVLWDAIHAHKKGARAIPIDVNLGNSLMEFAGKNQKGSTLYQELATIFLGKMKSGVETAQDDALSAFRRENVKFSFFTYDVKSLDPSKRDEAIALLSRYSGSTKAEDIYNFSVENTLAGGTMHSIVSYILLSLGGEYEKYGELLRNRMNKGDLQGKSTRVS